MKKIKIFLLFLAVTLLISSCEKNFDPKMYGKLFTTNFPKTEADYEAYMMACYTPFQVNWAYNLSSSSQYGFYIAQGIWRLFDMTSDEMAPNQGEWTWRDMSMANFANMTTFGRNAGDDTPNFEKLRDVTRFTEIIGVIQNAKVLSDTKKNNFLGEARLLRGVMMYYLFHIMGPVPVILDPALVGKSEAEQNEVRPTLTQMTESITADFEFAVANMVETTAEQGRYTADYARFCLMKHYLNEGSYMAGYYDKAIALYTTLKDHGYGLFTNGINPYVNQFKNANKFNKEVIMSVSIGSSGTGDGNSGNFNPFSWFAVPSDAASYADVANTIPTPFVNQGGGWVQIFNVAPAFYNTYESGDLRKNVIVTSYVRDNSQRSLVTIADIGIRWEGFIINKYPIELPEDFQATDIPLARWADVLLMYAEAVARKTNAVPTGEAMQAVNDVRARAGLAPLSGDAIASYNGFMNALLTERGHELLYEGCRKIDLIRFNKYRHNCIANKRIAPTNQYMPIPDYAVQQAASYGKTLDQWYERPDWSSDN